MFSLHKFSYSYKILLLFFTFCIINNSCKKKNDYNKFEILEKENNLIQPLKINDELQIKLNPLNIYGSFSNIAIIDTLLIYTDLNSPKLVSFYSLKTKKLLNQIINRGNKQNEGLSASNIILSHNNKSNIKIFDITLGKFFFIDILKAIKDTSYIPEKEIILGEEIKNIYNPTFNDSIIISPSYHFNTARYIYTDGQKVLKKIGKLPDVSNSNKLKDFKESKISNKAFFLKALMEYNLSTNKSILFYNRFNRIEIYNNDTLSKVLIKNKQENLMNITKYKDGFNINDSEKTKYYFLNTSSNDIYIVALYTEGTNEGISNKILLLDWNGKFLKKIILNKKISKVFISPSNELFCYESSYKSLYSVNLNQYLNENN